MMIKEAKFISNIVPRDIIEYVLSPYIKFVCLFDDMDGYKPNEIRKYNIIYTEQNEGDGFGIIDQYSNIFYFGDEFFEYYNYILNITFPKKYNVYYYIINVDNNLSVDENLKLLGTFDTFKEADNYCVEKYIQKNKRSPFIDKFDYTVHDIYIDSTIKEFLIISNVKEIKSHSLSKLVTWECV